MINSNSIKEILREVVSKQRGVDSGEIYWDMRVYADLGYDSLSFLELVVTLESHLDKEIDEYLLNIDDISLDELAEICIKVVGE